MTNTWIAQQKKKDNLLRVVIGNSFSLLLVVIALAVATQTVSAQTNTSTSTTTTSSSSTEVATSSTTTLTSTTIFTTTTTSTTTATTMPATTTGAATTGIMPTDPCNKSWATMLPPPPSLSEFTFDTYGAMGLRSVQNGTVEWMLSKLGRTIVGNLTYFPPGQSDFLPPTASGESSSSPSSGTSNNNNNNNKNKDHNNPSGPPLPTPPEWACSNLFLPLQTIIEYNPARANPAFTDPTKMDLPRYTMFGIEDNRFLSAVCVSPKWLNVDPRQEASPTASQQLCFDVGAYTLAGNFYLIEQVCTGAVYEKRPQASAAFAWRRSNIDFIPGARPATFRCAQVFVSFSEYGTRLSDSGFAYFTWTGAIFLGSSKGQCSNAAAALAAQNPTRNTMSKFGLGSIITIVPAANSAVPQADAGVSVVSSADGTTNSVSLFTRYFDNAAQVAQSVERGGANRTVGGSVFAAVKSLAQPLFGSSCFPLTTGVPDVGSFDGNEFPVVGGVAPQGVATIQMLPSVVGGMSALFHTTALSSWPLFAATPFAAMPTKVQLTAAGTSLLAISAPVSATVLVASSNRSLILFAAVVTSSKTADNTNCVVAGDENAPPHCVSYIVFCSVDITATCNSTVQQTAAASALRCARDPSMAPVPLKTAAPDQIRIQTVAPPLDNGAYDAAARLTTVVVHVPGMSVQARTFVPNDAAAVLMSTTSSGGGSGNGPLSIDVIEQLPLLDGDDVGPGRFFAFKPWQQNIKRTTTTVPATRYAGMAPDHQQGCGSSGSIDAVNGTMPTSPTASDHDPSSSDSADHAFLYSDRVLPPLQQINNISQSDALPLDMRNNSCTAFAIFVERLSAPGVTPVAERLRVIRLCDGTDISETARVTGVWSDNGNFRCNATRSDGQFGHLVTASLRTWKGYWRLVQERGMLQINLLFLTSSSFSSSRIGTGAAAASEKSELRSVLIGVLTNTHQEEAARFRLDYPCTVPLRAILITSIAFGSLFPDPSVFDVQKGSFGGAACATVVSNSSAADLSIPRPQLLGPALRGHRLVRIVALMPGSASMLDAYSVSQRWWSLIATIVVENKATGARSLLVQEIIISTYLGTFEFRHPIFTLRPGTQFVAVPSIPRFLLTAVSSSSPSSFNQQQQQQQQQQQPAFQLRNLFTTDVMMAIMHTSWNTPESRANYFNYQPLVRPPCHTTTGGGNICLQRIDNRYWFYLMPPIREYRSDAMAALESHGTFVPQVSESSCRGTPQWVFAQQTRTSATMLCFSWEPLRPDVPAFGMLFTVAAFETPSVRSSQIFVVPDDLFDTSSPDRISDTNSTYAYYLRDNCMIVYANIMRRYVGFSCGAVPRFYFTDINNAVAGINTELFLSDSTLVYFSLSGARKRPWGWRAAFGKGRIFYAFLDGTDDSKMAWFDWAPELEPPKAGANWCTPDDIVFTTLCGSTSWEKSQTTPETSNGRFNDTTAYYSDARINLWRCWNGDTQSTETHVTLDEVRWHYRINKMGTGRIFDRIEPAIPMEQMNNMSSVLCDALSSRAILIWTDYSVGVTSTKEFPGFPSYSGAAYQSWNYSFNEKGGPQSPQTRSDGSVCSNFVSMHFYSFLFTYSIVPFVSYSCDYIGVDVYTGRPRWVIEKPMQVAPAVRWLNAESIVGWPVGLKEPGTFLLRSGVFMFYNQVRGRFEYRRADNGRVVAMVGQPMDMTLPLLEFNRRPLADGYVWTDDVYLRGAYISADPDAIFDLDYREQPMALQQEIAKDANTLFDIVSGLSKLPDSWRRYNYPADWEHVSCRLMWNTPNHVQDEIGRRLSALTEEEVNELLLKQGNVGSLVPDASLFRPGQLGLNFSNGCWSEKALDREAVPARHAPRDDWTFNCSVIDIEAPDGVMAGYFNFFKLPNIEGDSFLARPKMRVLDLSGNSIYVVSALYKPGTSPDAPLCNGFLSASTQTMLVIQAGITSSLDRGWLDPNSNYVYNAHIDDAWKTEITNTLNFSRAGDTFAPVVSLYDLPCFCKFDVSDTAAIVYLDSKLAPGPDPDHLIFTHMDVSRARTVSEDIGELFLMLEIVHEVRMRDCDLRGTAPHLTVHRLPLFASVIDISHNPRLNGFLPDISWPTLVLYDASYTNLTAAPGTITLQMIFYTLSALNHFFNSTYMLREIHLSGCPNLGVMLSLIDVEYQMPRPVIPTLRIVNLSSSLVVGTCDMRQMSRSYARSVLRNVLKMRNTDIYDHVEDNPGITLDARHLLRYETDPYAFQLICPAYFPEESLGKYDADVNAMIPIDDFNLRTSRNQIMYAIPGKSGIYTCPGTEQQSYYPFRIPFLSDHVLPQFNISWDSPIVTDVTNFNRDGDKAIKRCAAHTQDGDLTEEQLLKGKFDTFSQDAWYDSATNAQPLLGIPLHQYTFVSSDMSQPRLSTANQINNCQIPLFWAGKTYDPKTGRATLSPYAPAINAIVAPCTASRQRSLSASGTIHKGDFKEYSQFLIPRFVNGSATGDFTVCYSGVKQWPDQIESMGDFAKLCEPGAHVHFTASTCSLAQMVTDQPLLAKACYQGFVGTTTVKIMIDMPADRSMVTVTRVQSDAQIDMCYLTRPLLLLANLTLFPGRTLFEYLRPCFSLEKKAVAGTKPVSTIAELQNRTFNTITGQYDEQPLNFGSEVFESFTFQPRAGDGSPPQFILSTRSSSASSGGTAGAGSLNQLKFSNNSCGPDDFPNVNDFLCNATAVRPPKVDPKSTPIIHFSVWPASYLRARAKAVMWSACSDGDYAMGGAANAGASTSSSAKKSAAAAAANTQTTASSGFATIGQCTSMNRLFPEAAATVVVDPVTLEVSPVSNASVLASTARCLATCVVANEQLTSMSPLVDPDVNVFVNCSQVAGKLAFAAKCILGDSSLPQHPVILGAALRQAVSSLRANPSILSRCFETTDDPGIPVLWLLDVFRLPLTHVGFMPVVDTNPNVFGGTRVHFQTCVPTNIDRKRWLPWANQSQGTTLELLLEAPVAANSSLRAWTQRIVQFYQNLSHLRGSQPNGITPEDHDYIAARSLFYIDTLGSNGGSSKVCDAGRAFSVTPCQPYLLPGSNISPVILTLLSTVKDVMMMIIGFVILDAKPVRRFTTRIIALVVVRIYPFTELEAADWAAIAMSRLDPRRIEMESFWELMVRLFTKDLKEEWESRFYADIKEYQENGGKGTVGVRRHDTQQQSSGGGKKGDGNDCGKSVFKKWFGADGNNNENGSGNGGDGGGDDDISMGRRKRGAPSVFDEEMETLAAQELLPIRISQITIEKAKQSGKEHYETTYSPLATQSLAGSPAAATARASESGAGGGNNSYAAPRVVVAGGGGSSNNNDDGGVSATPRASAAAGPSDEQPLRLQPQEVAQRSRKEFNNKNSNNNSNNNGDADPHREKSIAEIALEMLAAQDTASNFAASLLPGIKNNSKNEKPAKETNNNSDLPALLKQDSATTTTTTTSVVAATSSSAAAAAAPPPAPAPIARYDEESGFILYENLRAGEVKFSSEAEVVLFKIFLEYVCKERRRLILNPEAVRPQFAAFLRAVMDKGISTLYFSEEPDAREFSEEEEKLLQDLIRASTTECVALSADIWAEKLSAQPWLIIASMLYCLCNIIVLVVETVPLQSSLENPNFDVYQNVWFLAVNSGASVGILSNAMMSKIHYGHWKDEIDPLLVGAFVLMSPALITHIIPGAILFAWLPISVGLVCYFTYKYGIVYARGQLQKRAASRSEVGSSNLILNACFNNTMCFVANMIMQVIFNYMLLFYLQNRGSIDLGGYWGVVAFEYNSRSLDCTLASVAGSITNALQMISAIWI